LITRVEHKRSNVKPRAQRPAPAAPAEAGGVTAEIVPDEA
jgi:hypothetical protein